MILFGSGDRRECSVALSSRICANEQNPQPDPDSFFQYYLWHALKFKVAAEAGSSLDVFWRDDGKVYGSPFAPTYRSTHTAPRRLSRRLAASFKSRFVQPDSGRVVNFFVMTYVERTIARLTYSAWSVAVSGQPMDTPSPSWHDNLAWRRSRRRLDRYMGSDSIPECVGAIENYRGFGAYPHMKALHEPEETMALATKVHAQSPRVIVEIGTCWGGSLFVWARSNPQAELIVSMDLPGGLYGGGYHANRMKMYNYFVHDRPQTQLELLRCDTHNPASLEQLTRLLNGREIDFLFIDGDHTFEGVKQDFEMYSGLVRPGGLVAFHDINTLHDDHHVHCYWSNLREAFEYEEIVVHRSCGQYGIGVLTMPTPDRTKIAGMPG